MQGKSINGYTLQRHLGTGGMAEVWLAENAIEKKAAVKVLLSNLCADANVKSRFYNEAKVMVELNHPNICQVYDYGNIDGRPAFVMEYLEGADLKERLKRGHRFTEEQLRRWWNQLVSALNYTHKKGIVHRDIKPGNVFVDMEGNVKLLDFGIAKVRESISKTQTGQKLGTLMYMSPEQVKDSKHIDYRTDIYSLAVTFVHLLTGKRPYDSETTSDFEISEQIVYKPLNMDAVPTAWYVFLMPYLEKDPVKRSELRIFETNIVRNKVDLIKDEEDKTEMESPTKGSKATAPKPQSIYQFEEKPGKKGRGWIVAELFAAVVVAVVLLLLKSKKEVMSLDTQAYQSCQTVSDYRNYLSNFGRNAEHFTDAKSFVDEYMADSIEKVEQLLAQQQAQEKAQTEAKAMAGAEKNEKMAFKKCTTMPACKSYLMNYPQGLYVNEVKTIMIELEQNAQIASVSDKGTFSVSEEKKVYFAKGNLQYQASTRKWRIAPNPWDIIGEANDNISSSYSGWIDLFGWGTGGEPEKASGDDSDYPSFHDWGTKFGDGWCTLTKDEWIYVFDERITSSGTRFAKAMVNGTNGVILVPDDWSNSIYYLNNINKSDASYSGNIVNASTWKATFSPSGAVFFPAAGWRNEASTSRAGSYGYYWSATMYHGMGFSDIGFKADYSNNVSDGRSVRLARYERN